MLERSGLLIGPWKWDQSAAPANRHAHAESQSRPIFDLVNRQQLGLVRKQIPQGWPVLRWLARRCWHVLETEDESLLLTIGCPWGWVRPWEVFDADEHRVCTISTGDIYDAGGNVRVHTIRSTEDDRHVFLSKEKTELGCLTRGADGIELRFATEVEGDPYAKMALLAAGLILGEEP